ncbi:MAG: MFS transporter, partial [Bacteroidota bacterium]|nr:MFS transporter [Bacteroidota bacterium]
MADAERNITTKNNNPFAAISIAEYRNLMMCRFSFTMALRMLTTVLGWWIYNLTNDPFAIGLLGLSEVIPAVGLALYAGHVIDVSEKRKLMLICISLYAVAGILFFVLSTSKTHQYFNNGTIARIIYLIVFCTGVVRSFSGATFSVLVANIAPRNILQNAITWNQGMYLSASVTGHAVGGLLIAHLAISGTLVVIFALLLVALVAMWLIRKHPAANERGERKTWDSVKEGLLFVYKTKELLGAISLDLFAVLFGGAVAMVPVFARDILHIGAEGFGLLNAASDFGSILIVIWLTLFPLKKKQGYTLMYAVAGFGICIIIFGLSKLFLLSFIVLMISGMLDGISVVIRGTIAQLKTPD